MSESSADAGVVQSRVQLERLVAEDELAGRTIAGFAAHSVGLRGVDLDSVTLDRLDRIFRFLESGAKRFAKYLDRLDLLARMDQPLNLSDLLCSPA